MKNVLLLLQVPIKEKLKNAPDNGYQTGLIIGSFIPFALFVGLAYYLYYRAKNRRKNE
jgi:hypothetical protein